MYRLEVKFSDGEWRLSGAGGLPTPHSEPTKDRIEAFVDGFMTLRAGTVTFYRPDGGVEREAVYEPREFALWGRT